MGELLEAAFTGYVQDVSGGVERGRMGNQQYTYDREVSSDWRAKLGVDFFMSANVMKSFEAGLT